MSDNSDERQEQFPERMRANKIIAGKICPYCTKEIDLGDQVFNCRRCQASMHLECFEAAGTCESSTCSPGKGPAEPPASVEKLPEKIFADEALAGRTCKFCGQEIDLGDQIYNCPKCREIMHIECFEISGACFTSGCATEAVISDGALAAKELAEDEKICKYCGEAVKASARKCRFCGEFFSESDRRRHSVQNEEDEELTPGEIAFGILCGGLACIVSIIWMIQGKKKGGKLLLISVISQVVWGIMRALMEASK